MIEHGYHRVQGGLASSFAGSFANSSASGLARGLAALVLAWGLVLAPGSAPAADLAGGAQAFVETLARDAVDTLTRPDVPRADRIRTFRALFNDRFAVRSIGRFILGRHWRRATKAQQDAYLTLFEDLMVVSYVDRFASYSGNRLTIVRTRADTDRYATVFSQFRADSAAKPVNVDWRVGKANGQYWVMDVVVAGASMSGTLKSQFASIIRSNGNQVGGLITELRKKTDSLRGQ